MSIAQQGGPHVVDVYALVPTLGPDNSPADAYSILQPGLTCFVQTMSSVQSTEADQLDSSNTGMITFFNNPGIEFTKNHLFIYTNLRGVKEYHKFDGFMDNANLGRVMTVNTKFNTVMPLFTITM